MLDLRYPPSSEGSGPGELQPPGVRALVEVGHRQRTTVGELREQRLRVVRGDEDERAALGDRRPGTEDGGVADGVRDDAHVQLRGVSVGLAALAGARVARPVPGGPLGEGEGGALVHAGLPRGYLLQ